jgi:hypothetical protein
VGSSSDGLPVEQPAASVAARTATPTRAVHPARHRGDPMAIIMTDAA